MVLLDRFLDLICKHAAVVNSDPEALEKEVEIVKKEYGPWFRVKGFTDFKQLFIALHVAKAKKHPFSVAFVRSNVSFAGPLILNKSLPNIKMIKYSDTQNLATMLPNRR